MENIAYPEYWMRPERINSSIHVVGVIIGIVLFPILLYTASINSVTNSLLSASIYGLCFVLTFTMSSLFHRCFTQRRRSMLKKLDRISIYFLIAATYTPLITHYMQSYTGTIMLAVLWTMVAFGIVFELYLVKKYILFSVPIYIAMGCVFIFTATSFFINMPGPVMILVLTGVILYLVGVFFYVRDRWVYSHAVWHVFVLCAGLCHYAAIMLANFYVPM